MAKLFDGRNADGNSTTYTWNGGVGSFLVTGTLGTATVKLQMAVTGTTVWTDVGNDTTLTAAGIGNFQLPTCKLRANLSSNSTATNADADVL